MADCLLPAGQAWYGLELHASILVRLPSYCSKHLWCEQPVKEIQLTSICYVQICVYSSSYGDFLRSAAFADSTSSDRDIFVRITIALICSSPMNGHYFNFINVEVRVCYSFSKHNIFSTKAIELFIIVWYRWRDPSRKPATRFFDSTLKNSLTFASNTKTVQMAREEVAEVSYCYYSRDSREIVRKFPCLGSSEVYRSRPDILGRSARGPARMFSDVAPGKGLSCESCSFLYSRVHHITIDSTVCRYLQYCLMDHEVLSMKKFEQYLPPDRAPEKRQATTTFSAHQRNMVRGKHHHHLRQYCFLHHNYCHSYWSSSKAFSSSLLSFSSSTSKALSRFSSLPWSVS